MVKYNKGQICCIMGGSPVHFFGFIGYTFWISHYLTHYNHRIVVWLTRPERPKSNRPKADPKSCQLEIGAQRAPRQMTD